MLFAAFLLPLIWSCREEKGHSGNITVIVSLDAFRWDYPDIFKTPNLDRIAAEGVKATMLPSYPSSTFPNHFTLATGLYPDHHGIVNSKFWDDSLQVIYAMGDTLTCNDRRFFNGEPIWTTAEKQGVKTGVVYWVSCAVPFEFQPGINHVWEENPRLDYSERVAEVLRILSLPEEQRPRLVMVYFEDPDLTTHEFGPTGIEAGIMVNYLDSLVGVLHDGIKALPYGDKINLIVIADHGMTNISDERFVNANEYLKEEWVGHILGNSPANIYPNEGFADSIFNALKDVEHINVWKKENVPSELHYGSNSRVGAVVVAPETGWQFGTSPRGIPGAHGYFPSEPDMQVVFRACGPDFKENFIFDTKFSNTDIYPLLCHLLGIKPEAVDGSLDEVKPILK